MEGFLSDSLRAEASMALASLFIGMVYAFVYDTARIVRRIIVHRGVVWIAVEDITFWLIAAVHSYVAFYQGTNGESRGYIIIGIAAGAAIYRASVGVFYVRYITLILKSALKLLKKLKSAFTIRLYRGGRTNDY